MVLTLARKGLIERTPEAARSLVLRVDASELPALEQRGLASVAAAHGGRDRRGTKRAAGGGLPHFGRRA